MALVVAAGANLATSAEAVWSIEKLNAAQGNWSQLAGTPIRIEGRVSSHIKGQIRFQKCELTFRLETDPERKLSGVKNLEVLGRLQRDGNKFAFVVTDFKPLPTDREHFQSREAALRNPPAKELYELGGWAVQRGTFYDDKDLLELGKTCEARGLGIELRELPKDDVEGRFGLADKAVEFQFPAVVVNEIRHDACREWLARCLKLMPPEDEALAALEAKVKALFPDAFQPLKAWPTDLTRDYALDPQETYRQADANQRQVLHRLLGADVQWQRIARTAAADGSNGAEVADRIDRLIPERHSAAEQFRERGLLFRMKGIDTAPRSAALELAAAFRDRQQPERAAETLQKWLVAKERRLRPEEAPQFIELADDYLTLVNNEPKAVALLTEAHRREPQSTDVVKRFETLGYQFDGVRWKKATATDASAMPSSPTQPAAMPTQLEIGMTAVQLEQLLGRPSVITTMRTASAVDEVRVYGRQGEGSRLIVQLRRGPGETQFLVTRFDSR
ncbi:MAG: hypothetical protein SH850_24015 [Planctomycetaceae bacterium]|nr:hypothetical protein [Planctomycetaceae bacterium]